MRKKVIALSLTVVLCVTIILISVSVFSQDIAHLAANLFDVEFIENIGQSYEVLQEIQAALQHDGYGPPSVFPEGYGGHRIGPDGRIVLYVTDPSMATNPSDELSALMGRDNVITRMVEFSFAELHSVADRIIQFSEENPDHPLIANIHSFAIDAARNRFNIYMTTASDEQIAMFRELIMDSPMIVFIERPRSVHRGRIIHPPNYEENVVSSLAYPELEERLYYLGINADMEDHAYESADFILARYWYQGVVLLSGISMFLYHKLITRR